MKVVEPKHTFSIGSYYTSIYHANVDEGLPQHEHTYAHITYCASGSILITKKDKQVVLEKNSAPVLLSAGEWHEIEALSENTVFVNVFSV
jgi:quercetin dioxygenase-like cupin family protein